MVLDEKKIFNYMDLGFYIIFIPVILLLVPVDRYVQYDYYFFIVLMIYMAVIHYINRTFNVLDYFIKGDYLKGACFALLTILIAYLVTNIHVPYANMSESLPPEKALRKMRSMTVWLLYFIDICFSVVLTLVLEIFKNLNMRREIEAEKNKAELALYKSQINPHFMFNTLNTLYGLFITKSEKTEEVFIKFTDMIKYMYSNAEKDKITIISEVKYLTQFIDLHALRLGKQSTVNFSHNIDDDSALLPPMILITFVENAFKYGVSSTNNSSIDINLILSDNELIFTSKNKIFKIKEVSTGIGIENCRKRLELLYPDRYRLESIEEDGFYKIVLNIQL